VSKGDNMQKWIILIIAIFIMSGCATKYQSTGFSGGYSETQLGNNIFNVSFRGNGYTSRERASDFTLLRSAELSLQNGFKYFIITNSEKYTNLYTTPKSYNTSGNINGSSFNATTTQSGGITFRKPSTNNTIVCFKEKPKINGIIYKANFIVKSIKTKYEIK
jgi:hypothetical protein